MITLPPVKHKRREQDNKMEGATKRQENAKTRHFPGVLGYQGETIEGFTNKLISK
jgi:hypothetical protein